MRISRLLFTVLVIVLANNQVFPCSAIVLKKDNQLFLAKNFDWTYREGILIKNPRGTTKTAYFTHTGKQAQWTSKYGSITFNQNGREMPYGGMNEKGLVVEMLWLDLIQYNINEDKSYVNELEWIQYQLDNFETIEQVLDQLNALKVYPVKGKIHYILADTTGRSVIVEYLNGKPISYEKEAGVCQAITNNSVLHSEPYKLKYDGKQKKNTVSSYRYFKLEQEILTLPSQSQLNESYAFEVLEKVTIPKGNFKTMWSIVYNIGKKSLSYYTDTHKEIKSVHVSDLDFSKDLSYFPLNQDDLNISFVTLTEPVNFSYLSPALIHMGFDEAVTQDMSQHHFLPGQRKSSLFFDNYFHLEAYVPLEEDKQTIFLAIMDSEEGFNRKQAVTGGYFFNTVLSKGTFIAHVYGLQNGKYAMLAFIDENINRQLDFDKRGKALERYATFSDDGFARKEDFTFLNTSTEINRNNAKVRLSWK